MTMLLSRLSAFRKTLFRTTAFKLLAGYLAVFALFAVFMIGYVAWHTRQLIESLYAKLREGV